MGTLCPIHILCIHVTLKEYRPGCNSTRSTLPSPIASQGSKAKLKEAKAWKLTCRVPVKQVAFFLDLATNLLKLRQNAHMPYDFSQ